MARTLGVGGKVIRNKCEKPYFEQGGAYFSISHDGGFAVCALSVESEIGVDLTRLPRGLDADARRRLAARCFTPDEAKNVADTDGEELFARLWARREAVGKLEGRGVTPFFGKPIPVDRYAFDDFYICDGEKCGLIALCRTQADGVELLPLDESVRIERK
jgi:phosphopantetheinyl transferase (holo-ACP synthase)